MRSSPPTRSVSGDSIKLPRSQKGLAPYAIPTHEETTFNYYEATRRYLGNYGKPVAFYSDKFSVFRVNQKEAVGGVGVTQFARGLGELNIDIICANSAPAKGRVERANLTLQDRFVKELRLNNITGVDAANAFAPTFISDYNLSLIHI
jgi:hypothetical protein